MPTVYIETSIVSYLRRQTSTRVVVAARQILTQQWWDAERHNYELVTSQYVLDEAAEGERQLAEQRLKSLDGIPLLPLELEVEKIAVEILARAILPPKATVDALHISLVAYHGIEYLLTWNCKHIANAKILPRIYDVLTEFGYPIPVICTPEEMLGNESDEQE